MNNDHTKTSNNIHVLQCMLLHNGFKVNQYVHLDIITDGQRS